MNKAEKSGILSDFASPFAFSSEEKDAMKAIMTEEDQVLELIQRACRGNRTSFEAIVDRYKLQLEQFVRTRIRPELQKQLSIEEIANETFGRAYESLDRFDGTTEDAFLAWLAGIAKNVVLKEIDRLYRGRALRIDRDPSAGSPSPSRVMRQGERFDRLKEAMADLSPDHKEVILLCRIEGVPIKKAAERMNRSADAVKKLLWRALKELKSKFGETESLHLPDRRLGLEGDSNGE